MLIDCHAHLFMEHFKSDLEQVITRAKEAGVGWILNAGIDLESSTRVISMAEEYTGLVAAVGIHPQDAICIDSRYLNRLKTLAQNPKVVAIGEIGLDYHWNKQHGQAQIAVFKQQLGLAFSLNLPVILHCRDAEGDMLSILKEWTRENPVSQGKWRGVRHCFGGDEAAAFSYLEMGFMLSFGGYISYPSSKNMAGLLCQVPDGSILIETDCPFLPPQKYRGKRNEPGYLPLTAQALANARNTTYADIAQMTTVNAIELFGLNGLHTAPGNTG